MRVTVSHNKGLEGAKKLVNDSSDQLFGGVATAPVQIVDQQKQWNGDTMQFSFTARMGFLTAPFKGYVACTDTDVTVDIDLPPFLKQFVPEEKVKQQVEGRVKGLLT
jgi:hypothetical protein